MMLLEIIQLETLQLEILLLEEMQLETLLLETLLLQFQTLMLLILLTLLLLLKTVLLEMLLLFQLILETLLLILCLPLPVKPNVYQIQEVKIARDVSWPTVEPPARMVQKVKTAPGAFVPLSVQPLEALYQTA